EGGGRSDRPAVHHHQSKPGLHRARRRLPAGRSHRPHCGRGNSPVSKLILTVDDSASMRMLLKTSLTAQGFRIEGANDGVHGLERMHEVKPDLLITDINMPKMDGFELIEAVRG